MKEERLVSLRGLGACLCLRQAMHAGWLGGLVDHTSPGWGWGGGRVGSTCDNIGEGTTQSSLPPVWPSGLSALCSVLTAHTCQQVSSEAISRHRGH